MKTTTSITISIDLKDEWEVKLLNYIKSKGNRSKYLKRLIYDDLMGVRNQITTTVLQEVEIDEDAEAMNGFF